MDVNITGPKVLWTSPWSIPVLGPFQLTETILISWVVMALITGLCIWLTHDLKVEKVTTECSLKPV